MVDSTTEKTITLTELSKSQRRVLGVLIEKGMTTPDAYPLTLKAVTTGCNQKSNRDPVTNFSEEQVFEVLDQLREMGLVGVLHTESGRTERYRHYMRHRLTLSEPQLAILTELLLRGRQQLGELRSRASRMAPIDSLELLRSELAGLMSLNMVQSTGPLERRGAEVDHALYKASEGKTLEQRTDLEEDDSPAPPAPRPSSAPAAPSPAQTEASTTALDSLRQENQGLREEVETLRDELRRLTEQVDDIRRALGL